MIVHVRQSPMPAWLWDVVQEDGKLVKRFKTDEALNNWLKRYKENPPRKHGLLRAQVASGPRLSIPDQHLLRIARDSLKMNDAMLRVMGGPSKAEAREIIKRLTGKEPRENPREPANEHIRNAMTIIDVHLQVGEDMTAKDMVAVLARLKAALAEVEGVNKSALPHRSNRRSVRRGNPPLAILGNPRVVDADRATWAKLEYHRPDDPDDDDVIRVHEFPDGFEIGWLNDGSVQLSHPKHALWMEDGEPKR